MTLYAYRALRSDGSTCAGEMEAANDDAVAHRLFAQGMEMISARPSLPHLSFWRKRPNPRDALTLFRHLGELLQSGVSLSDAMSLLCATLARSHPLRDIIERIARDIDGGQSVAEALAPHATIFDPVFIAFISAGEKSGRLAEALLKAVEDWERRLSSLSALRRALRYPLFLLCVAGGVTSFMMLAVVPEIVDFLTSQHAALPWTTRALIFTAAAFAAVWQWALPLFLAGLAALFLAHFFYPPYKTARDRILLSLPFFGTIMRRSAAARWMGSLSLLMQGGLSLSDALDQSESAWVHPSLKKQNALIRNAILRGEPLSAALAPFVPGVAAHMIRLGENSGDLAAWLLRGAKHVEEETRNALTAFLGALEPALTLTVGALLAWIVLAVLGPLYGSLAPLSQGMP